MMSTVNDLADYLKQFAPLCLAESWDNVGLILGETGATVRRVLTCLTLTPDVADEALQGRAELIVTHHPVLFRPVQRLTSETLEGRMLLKLITAGIAVYSPHTSFDSSALGINQQLANRLGLKDLKPLRPAEANEHVGGGRYGTLPRPVPINVFMETVAQQLKSRSLQFVGNRGKVISQVGVACGAAGEYLQDAAKLGCDVFVTGETRFHSCLEARQLDVAMILAGHYATERFAMEWLAEHLADQFPNLTIWASRVETDPVQVP